MGVEFDPKKDANNIARHGVSLTEGDGVLSCASLSRMTQVKVSSDG